jgi:cell division protein FtsI/penicillin-binding protein 2
VTKLQAVTPGLAAHLVGAVAPVTAQELKTLGPAYSAGDTVGQSGLEGYYETRLAGTPGGTVTVVSAQGATVATLATAPPKAGQPVQTGIDPAYQRAGEAALAGVTKPAALVAVRASTGEILASVSQDPAGQDLDYALDATVAPGSTFKTITSTALLTKGLTPASPATCPTTITVDGETFHNFEGEAAAQLSFAAAFARSCNTAFIGLATAHLQASDFPHFAALYGIGTTPQMGYPAFGGKVPLPADEADLASTAIGQGRVVVSPLDMATVAAGIDAGTARAPRLVTGAPDDTAAPKVLDPTVVTALHQMMAQVVTSGTAAGYGLPAGTYAKTGTAEFGTTKPPQTHAWMIGFDGDVAFAVFVYGGGVGGPVAGPLAAKFLDALGPAA